MTPTPQDPVAQKLIARGHSIDLTYSLPTIDNPYVRFSAAPPAEVARALAEHHGVRFFAAAELQQLKPKGVLATLSAEAARQFRVVPQSLTGTKLTVLTDRPDLFQQGSSDLHFLLSAGQQLAFAVTPPAALDALLQQHYPEGASTARTASRPGESHESALIQVVNRLLTAATHQRASDILIQPAEGNVCVRFRVDGVLHDHTTLQTALAEPVAARLKVMASLDPSESRRPQDGKIQLSFGDQRVDYRVSFFRTTHGESIAIRILDTSRGILALDQIGLLATDHARLAQIIAQPNGLVLVSGPTGSGKTTTLYAALQTRNTRDVSIYTIEDPVEYAIPGIMQSNVQEAIGVTFQSGLRTLLRHNPNIILVGEIRDQETAEIATQAALTGHLVFSTIHTNDAVGAVTRLVDLGAERFVVGSALRAVVAQRLVRTLCEECAVPAPLTAADVKALGRSDLAAPPENYARAPKGCAVCNQSGYQGRLPVFEIFELSEPVRELVYDGARESAVRAAALERGELSPLMSDAFQKVLSGKTSVQEVLRVLGRGAH